MNIQELLLNRRRFLQALAVVGCSGPAAIFADEPARILKPAKARGIINIFLPGGMSAQESLDPKPGSPSEYRGPFDAIKTKLTGVRFSELMPRTAQVADKICVIRSMSHGEADHGRGTHSMYTGYRPSPAIQYPSIGSIIAHELGTRNDIPPYICVPDVPNDFAGTGYLSSSYYPFAIGAEPGNSDFKVRDLERANDISQERFETRKKILDLVDDGFKKRANSDLVTAVDSFYQKAFRMMASPTAKAAFDLNKEDGKLRDTYGRNEAGQRFLLARRLIEAGTRYVTVTAGGWDHHNSIKDQMIGNMPKVDQAYAALISDLDQKGMLDSTLVMLSTEFGRTPKINPAGGRDHYPRVFSIVMAGGGVKKGMVYGSSDSTSSAPDEDPVSIHDMARTIHHLIGVDPDRKLISPGGRPVAIVTGGEILNDILT